MRSERSVNSAVGEQTPRRAQIVTAAIETLAELGYANASLARIAERVGVSKGVINYHFAGKDELVTAVIAHVADEGERFIRARAATAPTAPIRLRTWIESNVEFISDHRNELVAFFEIAVNARGNARVAPAVAAVLIGGVDAVRELLKAGQSAGELRADFDPQVMAVAIRAAVDALPARWVSEPDLDLAHYGRQIADLFEVATRAKRARSPKGGTRAR